MLTLVVGLVLVVALMVVAGTIAARNRRGGPGEAPAGHPGVHDFKENRSL